MSSFSPDDENSSVSQTPSVSPNRFLRLKDCEKDFGDVILEQPISLKPPAASKFF